MLLTNTFLHLKQKTFYKLIKITLVLDFLMLWKHRANYYIHKEPGVYAVSSVSQSFKGQMHRRCQNKINEL